MRMCTNTWKVCPCTYICIEYIDAGGVTDAALIMHLFTVYMDSVMRCHANGSSMSFESMYTLNDDETPQLCMFMNDAAVIHIVSRACFHQHTVCSLHRRRRRRHAQLRRRQWHMVTAIRVMRRRRQCCRTTVYAWRACVSVSIHPPCPIDTMCGQHWCCSCK